MIKSKLVLVLIFLLVILTAYFLYSALKKKVSKKVKQQKERIHQLSQTEEGRRALEQEAEARAKAAKKLEPLAIGGFIFSNLLFFTVGVVGTFLCIADLKTGSKLNDLLFINKGFYLIAPILIVVSLIRLFIFTKELMKK